MLRPFRVVTAALCLTLVDCVPRSPNASATGPRFITSDVMTFATAYANAMQVADVVARAEILQREYLDRGTPGLQDFVRARKIDSAAELAKRISEAPRFYAWMRDYPRRLASIEPEIRRGLQRLEELIPGARLPDVYFVIGHQKSSGTVSERGMLIGAEVFAAVPGAPLDELSPTRRGYVHPMAQLPYHIVHEAVHTQQQWQGKETVLETALVEGTAEFLAGLSVPNAPVPTNSAWADPRQREIWTRFERDMLGTDTRDWAENNSRATPDWPAALAYYVGYRIAEAYYNRAANKQEAVRALLQLENARAILEFSGYGDRISAR